MRRKKEEINVFYEKILAVSKEENDLRIKLTKDGFVIKDDELELVLESVVKPGFLSFEMKSISEEEMGGYQTLYISSSVNNGKYTTRKDKGSVTLKEEEIKNLFEEAIRWYQEKKERNKKELRVLVEEINKSLELSEKDFFSLFKSYIYSHTKGQDAELRTIKGSLGIRVNCDESKETCEIILKNDGSTLIEVFYDLKEKKATSVNFGWIKEELFEELSLEKVIRKIMELLSSGWLQGEEKRILRKLNA